MNKLNLKIAVLIALFSFSMKNAFSTILTTKDSARFNDNQYTQVDINQDGIWDVKFKGTQNNVVGSPVLVQFKN
jgi:hypothetical protein